MNCAVVFIREERKDDTTGDGDELDDASIVGDRSVGGSDRHGLHSS